MWETHHLLERDVFSFTAAGVPFINSTWLSQVFFFLIYTFGGLPLLIVIKSISLSAAFYLIYLICKEESGSIRSAVCISLLSFFLSSHNILFTRSQSIAFPLFALIFFILHRLWYKKSRIIYLLPFIMCFWVNVHGSFLIGLLLVGAFFLAAGISMCSRSIPDMGETEIRSRIKRFGLAMVASFGATFVNPYGPLIYAGIGKSLNDPVMALIVEWQPTSFSTSAGVAFILAFFLFFLLFSRKPQSILMITLFIVFSLAAFVSVRMIVWWAMISAPVAARIIRGWSLKISGVGYAGESSQKGISLWINYFMLALFSIMTIVSTPWAWGENNFFFPKRQGLFSQDAPLEIIDYIRRNDVPDPIFHYFEWGSFFIWNLYPEHKVFGDGRFGIYSHEVLKDYFLVSSGYAHWEEILDHYGISTLILKKGFHDRLIPLVDNSKQWIKVHEDEVGVIYIRDESLKKAQKQTKERGIMMDHGL